MMKSKTSFNMGGVPKYYVEAENELDIINAINLSYQSKTPIFVFGEGSNIVLPDGPIQAIILKPVMKEIEVLDENDTIIKLKVGAGLNWDSFVSFCVSNQYWGIENMSIIPGTIGALPVQNVGAYGQDASKVILEVQAINKLNLKQLTISAEECTFGWRSSVFNTSAKDVYIITHVVFLLKKNAKPNLSRIDLKKEYNRLKTLKNKNNLNHISLVREAVINLRTSGINLPNDELQFNTGTFFRALPIQKNQFIKLFFRVLINYNIQTALKVIGYRVKYGRNDSFMLPSAVFLKSLISCKSDNFYLFESNPAVMIHNGKGTYQELHEYINKIQAIVYNKVKIKIPVEPTLLGRLSYNNH